MSKYNKLKGGDFSNHPDNLKYLDNEIKKVLGSHDWNSQHLTKEIPILKKHPIYFNRSDAGASEEQDHDYRIDTVWIVNKETYNAEVAQRLKSINEQNISDSDFISKLFNRPITLDKEPTNHLLKIIAFLRKKDITTIESLLRSINLEGKIDVVTKGVNKSTALKDLAEMIKAGDTGDGDDSFDNLIRDMGITSGQEEAFRAAITKNTDTYNEEEQKIMIAIKTYIANIDDKGDTLQTGQGTFDIHILDLLNKLYNIPSYDSLATEIANTEPDPQEPQVFKQKYTNFQELFNDFRCDETKKVAIYRNNILFLEYYQKVIESFTTSFAHYINYYNNDLFIMNNKILDIKITEKLYDSINLLTDKDVFKETYTTLSSILQLVVEPDTLLDDTFSDIELSKYILLSIIKFLVLSREFIKYGWIIKYDYGNIINAYKHHLEPKDVSEGTPKRKPFDITLDETVDIFNEDAKLSCYSIVNTKKYEEIDINLYTDTRPLSEYNAYALEYILLRDSKLHDQEYNFIYKYNKYHIDTKLKLDITEDNFNLTFTCVHYNDQLDTVLYSLILLWKKILQQLFVFNEKIRKTFELLRSFIKAGDEINIKKYSELINIELISFYIWIYSINSIDKYLITCNEMITYLTDTEPNRYFNKFYNLNCRNNLTKLVNEFNAISFGETPKKKFTNYSPLVENEPALSNDIYKTLSTIWEGIKIEINTTTYKGGGTYKDHIKNKFINIFGSEVDYSIDDIYMKIKTFFKHLSILPEDKSALREQFRVDMLALFGVDGSNMSWPRDEKFKESFNLGTNKPYNIYYYNINNYTTFFEITKLRKEYFPNATSEIGAGVKLGSTFPIFYCDSDLNISNYNLEFTLNFDKRFELFELNDFWNFNIDDKISYYNDNNTLKGEINYPPYTPQNYKEHMYYIFNSEDEESYDKIYTLYPFFNKNIKTILNHCLDEYFDKLVGKDTERHVIQYKIPLLKQDEILLIKKK